MIPDEEHSFIRKENRRRNSSAPINSNKNKTSVLFFGSIIGALSFHLILWLMCKFFGINLSLHAQTPPPEIDRDDRIIITPPEEEDMPEPPPEPVEIDPLEPEVMEIDPPDITDMEIEQVVIAPGETSLNISDSEPAQPDLPLEAEQLDPIQIQAGLPDVMPDPAFTNANDVTVNVPDMKDIDYDQWFNDAVAGAGGDDAAMNPEGSESLSNLLKKPAGSLGEGSGFARIGADLLFEYNKATLKQSAKVGLLQLAALIEKNQNTRFIIEGHTDSFGAPQYNKKLSLLRANAVRKWLASNGIDLNRIYIRACGAERTIVDTKLDKEKQAPNRRVEIHMRKDNEALPPDSISATQELPEYAQGLSNTPATPAKPKQPTPAPTPKPVPKPETPVGADIIEEPVHDAEIIKDTSKSHEAEVIEENDDVAEIVN